MSRVVHFEIMAKNPNRAVEFYQTIFGWDIKKWDGPEDYWLVTSGPDDEPGINGAIGQSQGEPVTVNVVSVTSVEKFAEKVTQNGGEIVLPKMAIPGVGYAIYCKDTEGIVFGLFESDETAK